MPLTSIRSYPHRGSYGKSNWRGNCSGLLIKDVLNYFQPAVFVDPMEGSGTSRDVADELFKEGKPIEYFGFDLQSGFNILRDSIAERIGGSRADYIFAHPAYFDIIKYSGEVWGAEAHPDDLSRCSSYADFLAKMCLAMKNIYDAVKRGKHFSILIGDVRKNGQFRSIQADLIQLAPGTLESLVIKQQHHCQSDAKSYANSRFVPIQHEYLLNFRKDIQVFSLLDTSLNINRRLQNLAEANWKSTVRNALENLGGRAHLQEIYEQIQSGATEKTADRPNWQARVRATLQSHFKPIDRGIWAIV